MPKIRLASPLGFSPEFKPYREKIKTRLVQLGYEVFDHWEQSFSKAIREVSQIEDDHERKAAFARLSKDVGSVNEQAIRECDVLFNYEIMGTPYLSQRAFAEPLGPGFPRRIDLPRTTSSFERKSSLHNGLPLHSCRATTRASLAMP